MLMHIDKYEITKAISKIVAVQIKAEKAVVVLEDKRDIKPLSEWDTKELGYHQGLIEGCKLARAQLESLESTGKCK